MVSIICPIYNEEKYIDKCIQSILHQDYPQNDMEVLFVDGMSQDRTRKIIAEYSSSYPFIKLLNNEKRIVPPAMNIGIRAAKGDIIIRLDAHAIFPENYISELIIALENLKADNVGGVCRTLPVKNTPVCKAIAYVLSSSFGMGNSQFRVGTKKIVEVDTVPFGCFKRSLFNQVGYFDEDLIRNQDDEFNGRIIKNGGRIYLLPHLVIDYFARDSIKKVWRMFYQYGLFKPLVNKKLGSPATVRQFFPLFFVLGILLGPLSFLINPIFILIYISVLIFYLFIATIFSIKNTHKIKEILYQVLAYLTVHLSYGWGYLVGIAKIFTKRKISANSNR